MPFCREGAGHRRQAASTAPPPPPLHLRFSRTRPSRRIRLPFAFSFFPQSRERHRVAISSFSERETERCQSPARISKFLLARRVSSFTTCFENTPWQRNRIPPFINSRITFGKGRDRYAMTFARLGEK